MEPEPQDLSAEELEALLSELLGKYKEASFQKSLQEAYRSCALQKIGLQAALGPLVLSVQKPLLEKYGLPANAQGVDLMKHAVQRRICEGFDKLEDLANKARQALGIEQLPKRHVTAEEQLQRGADDTAAKFANEQLWQQCTQMLQQATSRGAIPSASAEFLQELLERKEVSVPSILCLFRMAQLGIHVAQLQSSVPMKVQVLHELPSAEDFFKTYVLTGTPVVIRGAFPAGRFQPAETLPDFAFLRRKCSHRRVLVKSLGFQDGAGRQQFMTDPELKLPFGAYLDAVEACERGEGAMPYYLGKVPLRAELPELAEEVSAAISSPQEEYQGCFGDLLPEGVFTYFGCGRNTTSVHYDAHENLMVCLCGRKRLWLYPPGDARFVYPISKDRGSSMDFSRSSILPFRSFEELGPSDQARYPMLQQATPLEIFVEKGDMFYLPSAWWHCVEGSEDRNIILNWWFAMHPEKIQQAFRVPPTPAKGGGGYNTS